MEYQEVTSIDLKTELEQLIDASQQLPPETMVTLNFQPKTHKLSLHINHVQGRKYLMVGYSADYYEACSNKTLDGLQTRYVLEIIREDLKEENKIKHVVLKQQAKTYWWFNEVS